MYIYREDEMEYFDSDEDTDDEDPFVAVSYTHLTLPTIYSV